MIGYWRARTAGRRVDFGTFCKIYHGMCEAHLDRSIGLLEQAAQCDRSEMHAMWTQLDANGNGSLDQAELGQFCIWLFGQLDPRPPALEVQNEAERLLSELDADQSGAVDWDEFVRFWLHRQAMIGPLSKQKAAAADKLAPPVSQEELAERGLCFPSLPCEHFEIDKPLADTRPMFDQLGRNFVTPEKVPAGWGWLIRRAGGPVAQFSHVAIGELRCQGRPGGGGHGQGSWAAAPGRRAQLARV